MVAEGGRLRPTARTHLPLVQALSRRRCVQRSRRGGRTWPPESGSRTDGAAAEAAWRRVPQAQQTQPHRSAVRKRSWGPASRWEHARPGSTYAAGAARGRSEGQISPGPMLALETELNARSVFDLCIRAGWVSLSVAALALARPTSPAGDRGRSALRHSLQPTARPNPEL